jgi:hypothetical protein
MTKLIWVLHANMASIVWVLHKLHLFKVHVFRFWPFRSYTSFESAVLQIPVQNFNITSNSKCSCIYSFSTKTEFNTLNVSLWSCTFEHTLAYHVVLLMLCTKLIFVQQHKHQYFHKHQIPLLHHCLNQMEMHRGCHSDTMSVIKHEFNEIVKLKISKLKCSYYSLFLLKLWVLVITIL